MLASGLAAFAAFAGFALLAGAAEAVGPHGVLYTGETGQGREIKVVTDTRGLVKRGAFSVLTDCSGQFKPFAADIRFDKPLDRSNRRGFRDKGNRLDNDGTYSGRYKYEIKGKRKTSRKFKGKIDLEVVFRKNGKKYTTCVAEDLAFKVKRSGHKGGKRAGSTEAAGRP
jgi:hypothetical protein